MAEKLDAVEEVNSLVNRMLNAEGRTSDGAIYVGVDPGATGALAVQAHRGGSLAGCVIVDMPVTKTHTKGSAKNYSVPDYSANAAIGSAICRLAQNWGVKVYAVVESITPGQGPGKGPKISPVSILRMGIHFSCWPQVFAYAGFSYSTVYSSSWKVKLQVPRDKEESRQHAVGKYPEIREFCLRKKDHNRAEAFLLSEWARRKRKEDSDG